MKNNIIVKCVSLFCCCFLLLVTADCLIPGNEREIYDGVIRLHVLADSNSEKDQAVKLKVRDAILQSCGELFAQTENTDAALDRIKEAGSRMEEIAETVLAENGFDYKATAVWGREDYPTREYDGVSLPAGEYYSLRIVLGEGAGENWWCILFPPLCTRSAGNSFTKAGIDTNTGKVFSERKYIFRFRLLELFR